MDYSKLLDLIDESDKDGWLFNDKRGIYTLKIDVNLRIERREIDLSGDRFSGEAWADGHADPKAYRVTYEIYYGSSFIVEKLLVSVDGHRATLPFPQINSHKITQKNYHFAQIVDQLDTLDDYMDRAGLKVQNV